MTATIPELDLDLFAMARFNDVPTALRASDVLISGEGVGFSDSFNASKGSNLLQTDGELHRRMRAAVTRPLPYRPARALCCYTAQPIATSAATPIPTASM